MFKRHVSNIVCDSGVTGWQCRLQDNYDSFDEFKELSKDYNLYRRLGYKTALNAWNNNPVIQGSSIPSDFRKSDNQNLEA